MGASVVEASGVFVGAAFFTITKPLTLRGCRIVGNWSAVNGNVIDNIELHGLGSSINCLGRRVTSYTTSDAKEIAKLLAMLP